MPIDDESICPSAHEAQKLDSLSGSNESPSDVLGKRKRNDTESESDSEYKNHTESESDSEDRNDNDSESDSEETTHETEVEHENAGPSWFYRDPDGQIQGPVTRNSLIGLNDEGLLLPDTTVWKNGQPPNDAIFLRDMLSGNIHDHVDLVIALSDVEETTHDVLRDQGRDNAGRNWFYRDLYGDEVGPVSRNSLDRWNYGGFLGPVTTVRRVGQTPNDAIFLRDMLFKTSTVLRKRKRTDSEAESDSEDRNDSESESDSEDRNDSESESDSEEMNDSESELDSEDGDDSDIRKKADEGDVVSDVRADEETKEEHENAGPSWFYTGPSGKIQGPVSRNSLKGLNDKGLLWPDTTVWEDGQTPDDAILLRVMLSGKRKMTREGDLVVDLSEDEETTHDLLHPHETQEHDNKFRNWFYRDPYGNIQGPVPRNSLNRWSNEGFLRPVTTVWRSGQTPNDAILLRDMLLRTSIVLGKRKRAYLVDGTAASNIIPLELYQMIQGALYLRGETMNKNCPTYIQDQLKQCEDRIKTYVKRCKKLKKLSHDWKYFCSNPHTASSLVAAKPNISALSKMPRREEEPLCCCSSIDPDQKFPKTMNVPLDEEEKKIWERFKVSDQYHAGLQNIDLSAVDKHKKELPVDDPIVSLASKFAVTAFNKAIKMYVKKGDQINIHDFDIVECKYLKMRSSSYYFDITIDAFEEKIRGVYDTKVRLKWKDGSKSLMQFVLTDCKPRDDNKKMKLKKRKTLPDNWQDGSSIRRMGLRPRRNRKGICRGYDYQSPWGLAVP